MPKPVPFECPHCKARFPAATARPHACPRCALPLPLAHVAPPPSRAGRPRSAERLCAECGCAIDARALGRTCDHVRCQAKYNSRASDIVRENHEARAAKLRAACGGGDALPDVVGFLPANERVLLPIGDARRASLRAHLERVAREGQDDGHPTPAEPDFLADPLLGQACALCEGACCVHGAERAYLDARTLARFFAERPEGTAEEAVELYLGHVGAEGYDDSCIYHGPRGCTLPRALRAEVCNSYLCPGIRTLAAHLRRDRTRALISAGPNRSVVRLAIIDEQAGPTRLPLPSDVSSLSDDEAPPTKSAEAPPWLGDLARIANTLGVPFDPEG